MLFPNQVIIQIILQLADGGMDRLGFLLNFVTRIIPHSFLTEDVDYIAVMELAKKCMEL